MQPKKVSPGFLTVKKLVKFFYGKKEIIGLEKIPENNCIIVGNHTQTNGPLIGELYLPDSCYIWCAADMMKLRTVPPYAFKDFWSQKRKWTHPFYKALSYIIAPLAAYLFSNARTVAVYRDKRVMSTFRETVALLKEGANILIFPERNEKYNNILYKFDENFVDVARLYYKKTGERLTFVPMYVAPALKKTYIGEGIEYNPEADPAKERTRIADAMAAAITEIARSLPEHTVVPYRNIGRKNYLKNTDVNEVPR